MLSWELRVSNEDTADMTKERMKMESRYKGRLATVLRKNELRWGELKMMGSTSESTMACDTASRMMHTVTCSWWRHVQLSAEGKRIVMKATLRCGPDGDERTTPVKNAPNPAKMVTAMRAPSLNPNIWSPLEASRIAVSEMMEDPVAMDMPNNPFRATAKMQPHTTEM